MGRNTYTSRQVMESLAQAMKSMENSMPDKDRAIFSDILIKGRIHASQMDLSRVSPETAFLLSVIMEIMRKLEDD
ncbi:MAG: hypothetical protein ACYCSO_02100 [Cuniculiplasma sp.]